MKLDYEFMASPIYIVRSSRPARAANATLERRVGEELLCRCWFTIMPICSVCVLASEL